MFRRTIVLLWAAFAASVFLAYQPAQAGKTPPPAAPTYYSLHWRASTSVYWDANHVQQSEVIKWSDPRGMNDNGDVVGLAGWDARDVDPDHSGGNWEVFVYTQATGLTQNLNDMVATELAEDWPNWRLIDAGDINNFGEIVGIAEYRYEHWEWVLEDGVRVYKLIVDQSFGVFRYVPTGREGAPVLHIYEYAPVKYWMEATSINDCGDMLVHSDISGLHPHIYPLSGDPIEVADPEGGIGVWQANAINFFRDISGNARIGSDVNAVRYTYADDVTLPLGWLKNPGPSRWAHGEDINDVGEVVGTSTTGTTVHAFRYADGVMKDLGALGKSRTYGYGINNAGDCVGNALDSRRAFLYTDAQGMLDLKAALAGSLTPLPADFAALTLQALRINNKVDGNGKSRAWILGRLGEQACLLTPN